MNEEGTVLKEKTLAVAAHSEELADKLLGSGRNVLLCSSDDTVLFHIPTKRKYHIESDTAFDFFGDCDIAEYRPHKGLYKLFDNNSIDNAIITSERCNSSCIMCPYADNYRANAPKVAADDILKLIKYIVTPPEHLTVSGGEPTLIGDGMFDIMRLLNERFAETSYLFLTNGRIFSCDDYRNRFLDNSPRDIRFAIPIYGNSPQTHDKITRTEGSFAEAVKGIQKLIRDGCSVEIRIVVSLLNCKNLNNIANFIAEYLKGALVVNFVGLEMCGSAARNREQVWLDYPIAFEYMKEAINTLCSSNISVGIYNFPLCSVEKRYRGLCRRSISSYKIVYDEKCSYCSLREICGGIFNTTYNLQHPEVKPVKENDQLF